MTDLRVRRAVHLALLGAAAATLIFVGMGWTGPARPALALVTAVLLPGAAVLSRLPALDVPSWLGLSVVVSLSIETVFALAMVWTGWWSPLTLAAVVGGASCTAIIVDLFVDFRRHRSPRHRPAGVTAS